MIENNVTPPVVSQKKTFKTSDIYYASYLCAIDFSLKNTEAVQTPTGGKKVVFVFSMTDAEQIKAKSLFFGGSGTVKARLFVDHLRSMKQLCFINI